MMEQPLLVLATLALVSLCGGQDWTPPGFCHRQDCPQYRLVNASQGFEERLYVATDWITTKVEGSGKSDVMAAHWRLKSFCRTQREAGYNIPDDTWPVLLSVTEGGDAPQVSLSWFVPPHTKKPEKTDPSVTIQTKPEATVYVRVFGGSPSINSGLTNAKILRDALVKAGKTFDPRVYVGAGYDSVFSLTHHNEIWITAAPLNTTATTDPTN